jgi:hypothetical protein
MEKTPSSPVRGGWEGELDHASYPHIDILDIHLWEKDNGGSIPFPGKNGLFLT